MSHHNKPLAAEGLISYRYYNGAYGWVMIGAKDNADALREAQRSVDGEATFNNLWVWSKEWNEYGPVLVKW